MTDEQGTLEYFDLTYSSEPASYYYLILQIDLNQVIACWYHSTKNLVTGFARYPFEGSLKQVLNKHDYLRSEFKEVLVCVQHENYLVYPRTLVDGLDARVFELTNSLNLEEDQLLQTDLVNTSAGVAFTASHTLISDIYAQFKHVKVISHVAPRIEHELNAFRSQAADSDHLVSHIWQDHVDIRVYRAGKLILSNTFFQSGKEDVAYYVLYVAEVLEIEPDLCTLHVSGQIKLGDDTWNLLSKYWKTVREAEALPKIEISRSLEDYSKARFDFLTHALLCVS